MYRNYIEDKWKDEHVEKKVSDPAKAMWVEFKMGMEAYKGKNRQPDKDLNRQKGKENLIYSMPVRIMILKTNGWTGSTFSRKGITDSAYPDTFRIIMYF